MHQTLSISVLALLVSICVTGCVSNRPKPVAPSLTPITVQVTKASNAVARALPLVREVAITGSAPGDARLSAAGEQLQNAADALIFAENEVVSLQVAVDDQAERLGKSENRVVQLEGEKSALLKIVWKWRLIAAGVALGLVIYIFGPRLLSALKFIF